MATFPAAIVTPERTVAEEEVQAVILRTVEGDATFMPGHMRLIGALVPGKVRFQREDGSERQVAVHGGFVQVDPQHVTILAPMAELAEEIDGPRAERALEVAQARISEMRTSSRGAEEEGPSGRELSEAEEAAQRARLRLEVSRR